jgi:hypothetical protein
LGGADTKSLASDSISRLRLREDNPDSIESDAVGESKRFNKEGTASVSAAGDLIVGGSRWELRGEEAAWSADVVDSVAPCGPTVDGSAVVFAAVASKEVSRRDSTRADVACE